MRTLNQMRKGMNVLASADGAVKSVRSDVEDVLYLARNAYAVRGRECGNGIVLATKTDGKPNIAI